MGNGGKEGECVQLIDRDGRMVRNKGKITWVGGQRKGVAICHY